MVASTLVYYIFSSHEANLIFIPSFYIFSFLLQPKSCDQPLGSRNLQKEPFSSVSAQSFMTINSNLAYLQTPKCQTVNLEVTSSEQGYRKNIYYFELTEHPFKEITVLNTKKNKQQQMTALNVTLKNPAVTI